MHFTLSSSFSVSAPVTHLASSVQWAILRHFKNGDGKLISTGNYRCTHRAPLPLTGPRTQKEKHRQMERRLMAKLKDCDLAPSN